MLTANEPCTRCDNEGENTPAHYCTKQRVQYMLCLACQKDTGTGVHGKRLPLNGSDYSQW